MSSAAAIKSKKAKSTTKVSDEDKKLRAMARKQIIFDSSKQDPLDMLANADNLTSAKIAHVLGGVLLEEAVNSGQLKWSTKMKKYVNMNSDRGIARTKKAWMLTLLNNPNNKAWIKEMTIIIMEKRKLLGKLNDIKTRQRQTRAAIQNHNDTIKDLQAKADIERENLRIAENKLNISAAENTFKAANDSLARTQSLQTSRLDKVANFYGNTYSSKSKSIISTRQSNENQVGTATNMYFRFVQNENMRKQQERQSQQLLNTLTGQGELTRENASANALRTQELLGDMDRNQLQRHKLSIDAGRENTKAVVDAGRENTKAVIGNLNALNTNLVDGLTNLNTNMLNGLDNLGKSIHNDFATLDAAANQRNAQLIGTLNHNQQRLEQGLEGIYQNGQEIKQGVVTLNQSIQELIGQFEEWKITHTDMMKGMGMDPTGSGLPPSDAQPTGECQRAARDGCGAGLSWNFFGPHLGRDDPAKWAPYCFWVCSGGNHMLTYPACEHVPLWCYFKDNDKTRGLRDGVRFSAEDMQTSGGAPVIPVGTKHGSGNQQTMLKMAHHHGKLSTADTYKSTNPIIPVQGGWDDSWVELALHDGMHCVDFAI